MPYLGVNGIDLYYERHGQGPALILAHGAGGNHTSWWQQVSYFSQWYQVITFDHRGFGLSADVPDGHGRSAFVDDLTGLLDHLDIQQAALIAQSMGGSTCLGFTARHPDRVRALVMADTPGGINEPLLQRKMALVARDNAGRSISELALPESFRRRRPEMAQLYAQIMSFNPPGAASGTPIVGPTLHELESLKVPSLFIVGLDDISTPPEVIRMAQKLMPNSSLLEVPGAGHSVYFEMPEVFNYVVHSFLKRVEAEAEAPPVAIRSSS